MPKKKTRTKLVGREKREYIDYETGEVIASEHSIIRNVQTQEEFLFVYLEDISGILSLSKTEINVCAHLWRKAQFNTGAIFVNRKAKVEIAESLEVKLQTVSNAICSLTKKEAIIHNGTGEYILNPKWFWKGNRDSREKAIDEITVILKYKIKSKDVIDNDSEPD